MATALKSYQKGNFALLLGFLIIGVVAIALVLIPNIEFFSGIYQSLGFETKASVKKQLQGQTVVLEVSEQTNKELVNKAENMAKSNEAIVTTIIQKEALEAEIKDLNRLIVEKQKAKSNVIQQKINTTPGYSVEAKKVLTDELASTQINAIWEAYCSNNKACTS